MRPDDFYIDEYVPSPWGAGTSPQRRVDDELLTALRRGPLPERGDAEVALALARLVHDDLERFGTGGGEEMTEYQMRTALLALHAVVVRLALPGFTLPFRDFATFKAWWVRQGAAGNGGYAARRQLLADLFNPLHDRLADLEAKALSASLAEPISPHPRTGLASVDTEISDLRRQFQNAISAQDYSAVGLGAVRVTEALSRELYDPALHLRPGETEPPVANTKERLDRFVEVAAAGSDHAALRKVARATIELAQDVKHRTTPTRREAGMAGDAVIQLANILRRLQEPQP